MKILFVTKEYPPDTAWGGIASFTYALAPALAERGHEVHLLSCTAKQRPRDYIDSGVHVHRRGEHSGLVRLGRALRLPLVAQRVQSGITTLLEMWRLGTRFDVVHYYDWGAECWLLMLLKRQPSLVCLSGSFFSSPRVGSESHGSRDARLAARLEYLAAKRATVKVAPSELLLRRVRAARLFSGDRVEVIAHPVDPAWLQKMRRGFTEPTILFIGRLEAMKAPEILVDALGDIRKRIPTARVALAGRSTGKRDGKPYLKWLSESRDIAGCAFLGHLAKSELLDLAARCRVLAMPSWSETFGIAALEAMAAGMPVVVTAETGIAEFVTEVGGGTVVPAGDSEALAAALVPFLADEEHAARVGAQARGAVERHLSATRVAALFEAAYEAALEEVSEDRLEYATAEPPQHA